MLLIGVEWGVAEGGGSCQNQLVVNEGALLPAMVEVLVVVVAYCGSEYF
jgi:hypothetical protein